MNGLHDFSYVLALLVVAAAFISSANGETRDNGLKVDVYDGPTENCAEDKTVSDGKHVYVHFKGKFDESTEAGVPGKVFEDTRDEGYPYDFTVGQQWVIDGLDQGLQGLCQGNKVRLVIPPELAYDNEFTATLKPDEYAVPPRATLAFDIELLEVTHHPDNQDYSHFERLDRNVDGKLTRQELHAQFRVPHRFATKEFPDYMWVNEDQDKDGFISEEEFNGDGRGTEIQDEPDVPCDKHGPQDEL